MIQKITFLVIIFLSQLLVIARSGEVRCLGERCGLFFWGAHGHDSIWHISLVESALKTLPPRLPVFAGEVLRGYNYVLDLFVFAISRLFNLSSLFVFFKLVPIVLIFLLIWFSRKLVNKKEATDGLWFWLLFFIFFSGSFSYLLTLWHEGTIWNSHSLLAMPPGLMLTNLQYTGSLIFVLWFLAIAKKNLSLKQSLYLSVLTAFALAVKFYAGIILEAMFLFYLLLFFLRKRDFIFVLKSVLFNLVLLAVVVLLIYQPSFNKTDSIFEFRFLANIHPFIEEKNLFYLPGLANARYVLQNSGIGPRLIFIEGLTFVLFMLFSFGTRIIGVIYYLYLLFKKQAAVYHSLLFVGIIVAIACSSLLVQRGMWWNTIQFFYYSLFFASLLAAEAVYKILINRRLFAKIVIVVLLIILTIPSSLATIKEFSADVGISYIANEELRALAFLKQQPDGVVLTYPYKYSIAKWQPITKMARFSDNAYVAAFSGKQTFINDTHVLEILGIDYQTRADLVDNFFNRAFSAQQARKFIISNKIKYLYLTKSHPVYQRFGYKPQQIGVIKIFDNAEATIYRVD